MKWFKIILALAVIVVLLMFVRFERPSVVRQLDDGNVLLSEPEYCPPIYWKDSRYNYYDFKEDFFCRRIPYGITDKIKVWCDGKVYEMKICSKYKYQGEFEIVKTYKTDHAGMVKKYQEDIEHALPSLLSKTDDFNEISILLSDMIKKQYPLQDFEIMNIKVK
ncbi:MAG: hypothetical protein J6K16_07075 [Alphaproteobacteria bacterium]|nr:hypothetical protein [Alphaproteobacteria bacterium]